MHVHVQHVSHLHAAVESFELLLKESLESDCTEIADAVIGAQGEHDEATLLDVESCFETQVSEPGQTPSGS